jgi:acyl-[acyl-carrier-protein]-phospholipid O-acyltransferase/long-chain-fatty-acid--[acyl-carrier-protein] ligase
MTEPAPGDRNGRTTLYRDRAFWGMTATQFLGAFNDNVFKQLVLLLCVDYKNFRQLDNDPFQTTAQALFAVPFVLFSGFSGWLADRTSKRRIVIGAKAAEIVVMLAGLAAFLSAPLYSDELLNALFVVLCLMGLHSTVFGPSKYGILPELFHEHDLPRANGMIQMTTFLAIIFGMAVCGASKQFLAEAGAGLWVVSAGCVGIAVLGTLTSLAVRRTPVAQPGLRLTAGSFGVDRSTAALLRSDRTLLNVLLISCLFWFLGGVLIPVVNDFGKTQMAYNDLVTSVLAALLGVGIAAGCVVAGKLSHEVISFRLVRVGAYGMFGLLLGLAFLPLVPLAPPVLAYPTGLLLLGLGAAAGVFVVPLQVYLQARPPAALKGRMIGTMNLANWIAILLAAGFYGLCSKLFTLSADVPGGSPRSNISWTFAVMALLILPVAVTFHPPDERLE